MAGLARLAVGGLGLLMLFVCSAVSLPYYHYHYPMPPGLDPDEDANHRAIWQYGNSEYHPSYLFGMRRLWEERSQAAPIYFYRRTCGKGPPSRQIVLRLQLFKWKDILRDDASQWAHLLYLRWLIEVYWRLIVPVYALEPSPVFLVDFSGFSWKMGIANTFKIRALAKKINSAFHGVTGKGIRKVFILNPPTAFGAIFRITTTRAAFRTEDVLVVSDPQSRKEFQEAIGMKCLWEGFGGKSKLPLAGSSAHKAFSDFSKVDDSLAENPNVIRLTAEAENFPPQEAIEELQQKLAVGAANVASEAQEELSSQISTESGDS